MTYYEFVNVDDETQVRELAFRMGQAPRIGETIDHDGGRWRRIPGGTISAGVAAMVHGFPRVSRALPRNMPGCEKTKDGLPIIRSKQHERELKARHGLVEWD